MLPLGILLGRVRVLGDFFEPVIDLLRPLPPLAVLPVVMLFAGAGSHAKIAVVCYGASVPILLNAIDGVRNLHPMLHRVSRSLGLHPLQSMFLVDLPAALPHIVSGIRLSMAVPILIAVSSGMLLSADGLGTFLTRSQESLRIASELGGLVVIAACSLTFNNVMTALEARLLRWHYARVG
nr:ABC transporter permease subunit [Paraburkholderia strydomiana]